MYTPNIPSEVYEDFITVLVMIILQKVPTHLIILGDVNTPQAVRRESDLRSPTQQSQFIQHLTASINTTQLNYVINSRNNSTELRILNVVTQFYS